MASVANRTRGSQVGIPHEKGSKYYNLVNYYMDVLEYAYPRYKSTLDRLVALQNAYDNAIDQSQFPTWAKMATPMHFAMVQEHLPEVMDLTWNDHLRTYTLLPMDEDVDAEKLDSVEYALNYYVRNTMDAKRATMPSIINALKTGLGYTAIVPKIVSPVASINSVWAEAGKAVASQRGIGVGEPMTTLAFKNVSLGQIIPTDDGSDFNGHDRASHIFWVDIYSEGEFRRMFKSRKVDTDDAEVFGDVEYIIKQADEMGYHTMVPYQSIIADLGGIDMSHRNTNMSENRYVNIPVIKCYGDQEIVWIANGTTVIHHTKDPLQILNRNLVKWSCTVDNDKWHPMNPAEAGQSIAAGKNLYYNMILEMAWKSTKPYMLYDKNRFGNKPPVVGINGEVGVDGATPDALQFANHPQLSQSHLAVNDLTDKLYANATGQNMPEMTPGMVRGGLHAFEQAMNSSSGRRRMYAMIMEMGAVKPIGQLTMIYMPQILSGDGLKIREKVLDVEAGGERIKRVNLTTEDLQAAYEVTVDTRAKTRTTTDINSRIAMFQATANDPYIDEYARHEELIADYGLMKKLMPSRKRVREIQEREAEARRQQQQAERQAAAGQGNNAPGGTPQSMIEGAQQ